MLAGSRRVHRRAAIMFSCCDISALLPWHAKVRQLIRFNKKLVLCLAGH